MQALLRAQCQQHLHKSLRLSLRHEETHPPQQKRTKTVLHTDMLGCIAKTATCNQRIIVKPDHYTRLAWTIQSSEPIVLPVVPISFDLCIGQYGI